MIIDIETDPRHGLQVMRYHTWSTIRKQSVGEHSAQVARIMMSIDRECSRALLMHAILHDVGEMMGDLPWPMKRDNLELKLQMDAEETAARVAMSQAWGQPTFAPLMTQHEHDFFKMCESIEMWEFALMEQSMGNRYAAVIADRMLRAALVFMSRIDDKDLQSSASLYIARREEQESETREQLGSSDPGDENVYRVEKRETTR